MLMVPILYFLIGKVTGGELLQAMTIWNQSVDALIDLYLTAWLYRTHWFN